MFCLVYKIIIFRLNKEKHDIGGVISSTCAFLETNFNHTCSYVKSFNSISFCSISIKLGTMIVYIMK